MDLVIFIFTICLGASGIIATGDTPTAISPTDSTTTAPNPCSFELTCEQCVQVTGAKCYYCWNNSTGQQGCHLYPASHVFPSGSECPLSDARWGLCWLNFEALIIGMSVVAGLLLIAIATGLYCCCCRRKRSGLDDSEVRWERETEERERRHADRRSEREARANAVRQKYGLTREGGNYNRME